MTNNRSGAAGGNDRARGDSRKESGAGDAESETAEFVPDDELPF